ncbi:MAG: transcriptional repressor [Candidatus Amulumruptor caecigallinarius]|nr:transcriptional repressor [Candidatus Amulumruptor caecigallinarius]MCM1396507.1 transcriptional repressor [Candidatus Amulumruptor caecigallinarius]MCM1453435.1 transcriptional repressor [bacterium]
MQDIEQLMEQAGIRPTSNRVLVMRALEASAHPLSLAELEAEIGTMERSSVFRTLTLLLDHHLLHAIEDGRGIVKYELCHGHEHHTRDDMHVHFYCEGCHEVFCFEELPVPDVELPEGFEANSVNYMLKGLCPRCSRRG